MPTVFERKILDNAFSRRGNPEQKEGMSYKIRADTGYLNYLNLHLGGEKSEICLLFHSLADYCGDNTPLKTNFSKYMVK